MCSTAVEMPSVDGDTGSDTRTVSGWTSAWYKVLISEGSNFSNDLSYTATLTSPPGMLYQLFVYTGDSSMPKCLVNPVQGAGTPATVKDGWSDSLGTDDSTWITLEVRYASGDECNPPPKWTLTVQGHTN
jgi:hypothetical protein